MEAGHFRYLRNPALRCNRALVSLGSVTPPVPLLHAHHTNPMGKSGKVTRMQGLKVAKATKAKAATAKKATISKHKPKDKRLVTSPRKVV